MLLYVKCPHCKSDHIVAKDNGYICAMCGYFAKSIDETEKLMIESADNIKRTVEYDKVTITDHVAGKVIHKFEDTPITLEENGDLIFHCGSVEKAKETVWHIGRSGSLSNAFCYENEVIYND